MHDLGRSMTGKRIWVCLHIQPIAICVSNTGNEESIGRPAFTYVRSQSGANGQAQVIRLMWLRDTIKAQLAGWISRHHLRATIWYSATSGLSS